MRFQSDTKAIVLAVVAQGPTHGYAIAKAVRAQSDGALRLSEGQLYPVLYALEAEGWVSASWENDDPDSRRRVYSVTEAGLAELAERTQKWQAFVNGVARVLAPSKLQVER